MRRRRRSRWAWQRKRGLSGRRRGRGREGGLLQQQESAATRIGEVDDDDKNKQCHVYVPEAAERRERQERREGESLRMRLSCSHKKTREGVRLRRFGVCAWCAWTSKEGQSKRHLVLRSKNSGLQPDDNRWQRNRQQRTTLLLQPASANINHRAPDACLLLPFPCAFSNSTLLLPQPPPG